MPGSEAVGLDESPGGCENAVSDSRGLGGTETSLSASPPLPPRQPDAEKHGSGLGSVRLALGLTPGWDWEAHRGVFIPCTSDARLLPREAGFSWLLGVSCVSVQSKQPPRAQSHSSQTNAESCPGPHSSARPHRSWSSRPPKRRPQRRSPLRYHGARLQQI